MSISYDQAMGIVQEFVQQICEAYPEKILAVYTVGSLAGGYYRPGQSNIDTVVLADATPEELEQLREEIDGIASGYCEEYQIPMGFIATVLSKEELYPPYDPQEELPWTILRLKCQSQPGSGAAMSWTASPCRTRRPSSPARTPTRTAGPWSCPPPSGTCPAL